MAKYKSDFVKRMEALSARLKVRLRIWDTSKMGTYTRVKYGELYGKEMD